MAILHSHRNVLMVVEHARVHVEDGRLIEARADSGRTLVWNIPHANIACLLLGQGASLTQEAAHLLSAERVLVGFSGTGGVPLFLAAVGEYRPTERAIAWMNAWQSADWRLSAAKRLHRRRLDLVRTWMPRHGIASPDALIDMFQAAIASAPSIDALRGSEAVFAKSLYAYVAQALDIPWKGRQRDIEDEARDLANRRLDAANYLAYGAAAAGIWVVGLPFFLPVQHGAGRAGGLVFDAADVLKDAICLPGALQTAHLSWPQAREEIVRRLQQADAIAEAISWVDSCLASTP
jgi:CRISPR-associated protein Cas1